MQFNKSMCTLQEERKSPQKFMPKSIFNAIKGIVECITRSQRKQVSCSWRTRHYVNCHNRPWKWKVLRKWDFFYQSFLDRHWQLTGQQGKGGEHLLSHSATSTHSRKLRHLFVTLHVRQLSRIFNRNACVYQNATCWDLPPYQIIIWAIDWRCRVCLFSWWIDTRFLLQRFDIRNQWVWTRIDYHPYITSEPTNQVC